MKRFGWLEQRERGKKAGMLFLFRLANLLGLGVTRFFMVPIIFYFYVTGKRARHASLGYLSHLHAYDFSAHRKPTFFDGFRHFLSFSYATLDKFMLWCGGDEKYHFESDGDEELLSSIEHGQGCFVVGAHFGNFEMLRVLALKQKITVHAVMHLDNAEEFNRFMREINPDVSLNIINLKDRNIEAMLELKAAIDAGDVVALLADRFYPSSRDRAVEQEFLGASASFPANPWMVAHLLEAPLFFAAGVKLDNEHYKLVIEKVADKVILHRKNRQDEIGELLHTYIRFLERLCVKYPYQWYNFYDFWSQDGAQ